MINNSDMAKILIAEDEEPIRIGLVDTLESEGYEVVAVPDGQAALDRSVDGGFDLYVLDIMMPKVSGYDVCRGLRKRDDNTPVLMLSAKSDEIDKVVGFELGCDDYVTKPFGVRELLARINALLRRATANPPKEPIKKTVTFGAATVHRCEYRAVTSVGEHRLSQREVTLIDTFLQHPNQVLSRDQLLNAAWGMNYFGTTRTLDQHIAQLRKKIETDVKTPTTIITVHGVGYQYIP